MTAFLVFAAGVLFALSVVATCLALRSRAGSLPAVTPTKEGLCHFVLARCEARGVFIHRCRTPGEAVEAAAAYAAAAAGVKRFDVEVVAFSRKDTASPGKVLYTNHNHLAETVCE